MNKERATQSYNISKQTCYIYSIDFNGIPIYIGSTSNIKSRQASHLKLLCDAFSGIKRNQKLYEFLYKNNMPYMKLNILETFTNDVILGNMISISPLNNILEGDNIVSYTFEEKRFKIEESYIKDIFNDGGKLFNIKWPCKYNEEFRLKNELELNIPDCYRLGLD